MKSWMLTGLAAVLLSACVGPVTRPVAVSDAATKAEAERQAEIAAHQMVEEQKRLSRVHRDIAVKAADLCGSAVGPSIGAFSMTRPKGEMGVAFSRLYGIGEVRTVLFVHEGGPADKAGIRAGDAVVRINGLSTTDADAIEKMLDEHPPTKPMQVEVRRKGAPLTFAVAPERACKFPVALTPEQVINAFADGKRVLIARGMMSFARTDNELALVIAHEMAHNVMKHLEARQQNMGAGFLADLVTLVLTRGQVNPNFTQAAAGAFSQEFEAEADYVGLYLMAAAGMPIEDAPNFWRRMAAAHPASIRTNHAASHPSTAYRMVALEEAVKEILDKKARGMPLRPNLKDGKPAAPEPRAPGTQ